MHMPRDLSLSSLDTDQDLENTVQDSDVSGTHRRRKKISQDGRTSPSFMEKVNAFFRSDSSDSSSPPSPTKTNNKQSLLNGLMTFALDPGARGDMPSSPTSVRSDRNGYPASIRSDPGPPRKYSFNSSGTTTSMGLPPRPKKTNSSFTRGKLVCDISVATESNFSFSNYSKVCILWHVLCRQIVVNRLLRSLFQSTSSLQEKSQNKGSKKVGNKCERTWCRFEILVIGGE